MFLPEHDAIFERSESFGNFDEDGLPTTDSAGEPLSKSTQKKLRKVLEKHAKVHAAYLAEQ